MTELEQINAKLDRVLVLLEGKPKAHLRRFEFARLANMHPNTVTRKIADGLIRTEKGRIPYSELKKFTSC